MEARRAHNPEVVGSSPASATRTESHPEGMAFSFCLNRKYLPETLFGGILITRNDKKGVAHLKRNLQVVCCLLLAICLSGCEAAAGAWIGGAMLIPAFLLLALALMRTRSLAAYRRKQRRRGRRVSDQPDVLNVCVYALAVILTVISLILTIGARSNPVKKPTENTQPSEIQEETEPAPVFVARNTANTDPNRFSIRWEIFDGTTPVQSYQRENPIFFAEPEEYFALPGVSTFRGNNYRNSPSYGTAVVENKTLSTVWSYGTGVIEGGSWSGNGWTGQPLIVTWDAQTRQIMNLYPEKKAKENLTEVIYASLDGMIYFLDLDDGSETRAPIKIGLCFKGAGTLDPRGYPLLYVGAGDDNAQGDRPRMFIISLIDGQILYQYGHEDDLAYREDNDRWCAFDSAPLIHAETDTLIWPGENGILYTIGLNTAYDKAAGTISLSPDEPVLTRYLTGKTNADSYWCGYEASANIVDNYLYVSENGGMFYCIDLNTMELIWAQDTKDDSNSSPVFEKVGENEGYIYTAPSLHWTRDANDQGTVSIYKLSATTGEILWERPYKVHTVSGVSGGVQSTPLLGREGTHLEGMIYYAVSRTNTVDAGTLVALDTATGEEVWRIDMAYYAWSSPVGIYDAAGNGYVVLCDSNGTAHFIDGVTGQVKNTVSLDGLVEASPAVYNNMIVVGTRAKKIWGIRVQ